MDELLSDFLQEVTEGLAAVDNALVVLERTPDDGPTLALIFRQVHTIKGTCGFLGLPRLERVAHAAEDVLVRLRDRELDPSAPVIDAVLASIDRIRAIVAGIALTGAEPEGDDRALIATLTAVASGVAAPRPADPDAAPASPANDTADLRPPATAVAATDPGFAGATVRVAVETLEAMMTLVGELVLTRNQLLLLARGADGAALGGPLHRLSRLATELQDVVVRTRMQPIGTVWNKLPRLVRDLAQELGKPIELVTHGAETELDRQVLEQIRDPLTHIVRNAADHGLESPDRRARAGKPPTGRIALNAFHQGGHVVVTVTDDGAGLDDSRIRARILSRGLATEAELAAMTATEVQQFIFRPGFSTAEAITAVSGRGVGMDVVCSNIERINGSVELGSRPGEGTTLTVRIPLTLAIVPGLVLGVAEHRFVLPQLAVLELLRVGDGGADATAVRIETVAGGTVLRHRDALLPLIDLAALLGLDARATGADAVIVVVETGTTSFAMTVDAVFDTEEIVVKPVAPPLRALIHFGGTTILGDGSVSMILDPGGIARAAGIGTAGARGHGARPDTATASAPGDDTGQMLLLFRAGSVSMAMPLAAVTRLETIDSAAIERSGDRLLLQYRNGLLPLASIGPFTAGAHGQAVIVLQDEAGPIGLLVDEIVDVDRHPLRIELDDERPGVQGVAVINGRATEIIDVAHHLARARRPRTAAVRARSGQLPRVRQVA